MKNLRAIVLSGDGINCEVETAAAARESGFATQIIHVNDLAETRGRALSDAALLLLPGGFSFGDELGSGKILALKLKHGLANVLERYIQNGGAVLGICNGFQVLTRLGVFGQGAVLTQNRQGHFIDRWVELEITGSSIFTDRLRKAGFTRLELPIRHGEGRLLFNGPRAAEPVLRYVEDVNGAWERTAGLSAFNGRVMGLMPHPEAFWTEELHPWGTGRKVPLGIELFRSAYDVLSGEK